MGICLEPTPIADLCLVRQKTFVDERGAFRELFKASDFAAHGLPDRFEQVNESRSRRGVIRGLHFQFDPPMGKLMRVARGRAFLVAVDLRTDSPTLGRWHGVELDEDEPVFVWAPAGFARGFATLSERTDVEYLCTAAYNPGGESGILWSDPEIAIAWPVEQPLLSPKDAGAGTLADWLRRPEAASFRLAVRA